MRNESQLDRPNVKQSVFGFLVAAVLTASAVGVLAGSRSNLDHDDQTAVRPEDRSEVIDRLAADIPVPPGGGFDALRDGEYVEDETSLAGTMAFVAACDWAGSWLDGNSAERSRATEILAELPGWPHLTAVAGESTINYLRLVAQAAERGDHEFVHSWFTANACG